MRADEVIVTGVLKTGEEVSGIEVFHVADQSSGTKLPISNANLTLTNANGDSFSLVAENGSYSIAGSEALIQPGATYQFAGKADGSDVKSVVVIPDDILSEVGGTLTYTIDLQQPERLAFQVIWNEVVDHSYILTLENVEESPIAIPFVDIEGGRFATQFDGPYSSTVANLLATDFKYYGHHKLKVYAIDKNYESFFFFNPANTSNLVKSGLTNITGGRGFLAGVSSFTIDLNLLQ
jgi:hypothetical protein